MSAAPVQAPGTLRSGRSSASKAATFSVVPMGEVDSRMTRLPTLSFGAIARAATRTWERSEEHTSELQSLMRISYAVFCLKKKKKTVIRSITKYPADTETTHVYP